MPASPLGTWEDAVRSLLDRPEQAELVRACYYDRPALGSAERFWRSEEWAATCELMPRPPGLALDVGAGHGIASYALARDPSDLVGVGAIRSLATDAGLNVRVLQGSGENVSSPANVFDLAYGRAILHHSRDLQAFVREIHRVLKPGGTFCAVREHVVSSAAQIPFFLDNHPLHHLYGGENAFRLPTYLDALRAAGFRIERVLGPFASVINFAPNDRDGLRRKIGDAMARLPAGRLAGRTLRSERLFDLLLTAMNALYRRPGRLYSFLARKAR
jgi:SAM-dependent methyltransferase